MRGTILIVALLLTAIIAVGQPSPDVLWTHTYGGSYADWAGCILPTTDGGFVASGMTSPSDAGGTGWLFKTTGDGIQSWSRTFGRSGHTELRRAAPTADGGYILCGMTTSDGQGQNAILVKTNAEGDSQWTHTYGGAADEFAWDVRQTADGGYAFAGCTSSSGSGGSDAWLVKVNSEGTQLWSRTYGGTGTDLAYSLDLTPEGGFYLGGYTASSGNGGWDVYVIKTDGTGNPLWTHTFGGTGSDFEEGLSTTQDGGVIVCGVTNSVGAEYSDAWLIKLDAAGTSQWQRNYGGSSPDAAMDVMQLSDGSYIFVGITGFHPYNGLICRLDAQGNPLWSRTVQNNGETWLLDVRSTVNHGYVIAGLTGDIAYGSSDAFVMRLAPDQAEPEHHFIPVPPSGQPYDIVVDSARADDQRLTTGDEIGIFDGDLCVGVGAVGDWPLTITTWQADSNHQFPGFTVGHAMAFRYWLPQHETEIAAQATLSIGDGNFGSGVYSRLSLASTLIQRQVIRLAPNMSHLISLNVQPSDADVAHVFGALSHLVAAYQDNGNIFIPPHLNTIGDLSPLAGYRLFTTATDSLVVNGIPVNPVQEYHLTPGHWSWISYPEVIMGSTEGLLAQIAEHLVIIQDDEGHAWIPSQGINTLPHLLPGKGYMLIVNQDMSFAFGRGSAVTSIPREDHNVASPLDGLELTGLPYEVVLHLSGGILRSTAQTISLYDGSTLVGEATAPQNQSTLMITAWQGIPEQDVRGFTPGHSISVVIKTASGEILPAAIRGATTAYGSGPYAELQVETSNEALPAQFIVGDGYPNPFNPSVTIPFTITQSGPVEEKVINTLGQTVFSSRQEYAAGDHRCTFDSNQLSRSPVSGLYFIQLRYGGQSQTRKVLLVR